jgi:hypothetical protein
MSLSLGDINAVQLPSPPSSPLVSRPQPPSNASPSPRRQQRHAAASGVIQRHLSPRKFQQVQREQRAALLRSLPLSPLSLTQIEGTTRVVSSSRDPVPWNPAWLPSDVLGHHRDGVNDDRGDESDRHSGYPWSPPRGFDVAVGTVQLREWVRQYELDFVRFESLDKLALVKIPEALALADKLLHLHNMTANQRNALTTPDSPSKRKHLQRHPQQRQASSSDDEYSARFYERFRIAVFAHLMDRAVLALVQSAALSHARSTLLLARQELMSAIFADYEGQQRVKGAEKRAKRPTTAGSDGSDQDDRDEAIGATASRANPASSNHDSELKPRTLSFFLRKTPFAVKMREESRRRAEGFARHEVVLRRVIQSLYRSLGSVFHAWKRFAQTKREERLSRKGAQLTAMVVLHRGLVRSTFVEWSKAALRSKVRRMQDREAETARVRQQEVADLRNEVFVLHEKNTRLQKQLSELQQKYELDQHPVEEDDSDEEVDDRGWDPAVNTHPGQGQGELLLPPESTNDLQVVSEVSSGDGDVQSNDETRVLTAPESQDE